ncbi:hypothetical protein CSC2_07630 [Clostridium zeae]|uniref:HTH tetR-type domain-containing protein n=1 Tax=Clostridium zeae TaxID=2759022 RepID=A0ABQ1E650_9CLOT|nr:TetR/AcrR family transcriptional regulator [Clostridium zeae]GFZ30237.1 hypothetical protein CSC2_07630 [Clostridium zeae]
MDEVKNRILVAAKELFAAQGYKKTTIRQIVEKSGVLIGSIYHFFESKEDIFEALVLILFNRCEALVKERFSEKGNSAMQYALMCAIELKAVEMNELICELYYEAYSSNKIIDKLIVRASERSQLLFEEYNVDYTYEDYYIRTLMIKGAMRSCIASYYQKKDIAYDKMINTFLQISLQAFNVNEAEIQQVTRHIVEMQKEIVDMVLIIESDGIFI